MGLGLCQCSVLSLRETELLATSLRLLLVSDDEIVARSLVDGLGHQSLSCDVVVSTDGARQRRRRSGSASTDS